MNILNDVSKQVFKLAFALASSRLISTISGFIGIILLARYNAESLAASTLISATQMVLLLAGMGVLFSTSILVGHCYGAKQLPQVGKIGQQGILLALILSLPLVLGFWLIGPILKVLHQPISLIAVVGDYFKVYSFAAPAIMMLTVIQQTLFSIQKPKVAIASDCIGLILIVCFGYSFIYGNATLGIPEMGVLGLAYASIIQAWVVTLGLLAYIAIHSAYKKFEFFNKITVDKSLIFTLFNIGWPISINITGELLSLFATTVMVGWIGIEALDAQQVASQYLFLLVVPLFGISQAISILSSHLIGANQHSMLRAFGAAAIKLGFLFTLGVSILFACFPDALISVFIDVENPANVELVKLTSMLLIIVIIGQYFDALRNICIGSLRSLGITKQPMLISLGYIWLLSIPLSYILGFILHLGLPGIAVAHDVGMLFAGITIYKLWLKKIAFEPNDNSLSSAVECV